MAGKKQHGSAPQIVLVPRGISSIRIDKFLASDADLNLTRNRIQTLIENGMIAINGHPVSKKLELRGGESIWITIPPTEIREVCAESIPLDIVFEDSSLLIVNKPAGMVTHPAPGHHTGTLVHAVMHHIKGRPGGGAADRPGIVHRLDKDTSGLLVVAKTEDAFAKLQASMQRREIARTYAAIVWGHMKEQSGTIESLIGRSTRDRTKMSVSRKGGREAVTQYTVTDRFRFCDLLDVALVTGRTHQIRVHCSHVGHPILGDHEYSGRASAQRGLFAPDRPLSQKLLAMIDRQALHAKTLRLDHTVTGECMTFHAPLPDDFSQVLALLDAQGR